MSECIEEQLLQVIPADDIAVTIAFVLVCLSCITHSVSDIGPGLSFRPPPLYCRDARCIVCRHSLRHAFFTVIATLLPPIDSIVVASAFQN